MEDGEERERRKDEGNEEEKYRKVTMKKERRMEKERKVDCFAKSE